MPPPTPVLVLHGTVVHTTHRGSLTITQSAVVGVDRSDSGKILFVTELEPTGEVEDAIRQGLGTAGKVGVDYEIKSLRRGQFVLPGFCDTHVHAPQYRFVGGATDKPLMEWLNHYTFPTEVKMKDLAFAKEVYGKLVRRLLKNGTTTTLYFATIDEAPTRLLVDICAEGGQRALIGKVCADQHSPAFYIETTSASLTATESFIKYVHAHHPPYSPTNPIHPLIHPVVTPRFIPTCSPALLTGLGELALKYSTHIQSHISESLDEIAFVHSLYPPSVSPHFGSDAAIFDSHGLLTDKAVMAHGVHLTVPELNLMADRGTSVACCPLSNVYFAGGNLDVRKCWKEGVDVGLGTDVAGGPLTTIVQAMRWGVGNSKQIEVANRLVGEAGRKAGSSEVQASITWQDALYLATLGGAKALHLDDHIGTIEVGKEFDALVVDVRPAGDTAWDCFEDEFEGDLTGEQVEAWVEKFVNLGDDRNLEDVYVKGRRVAGCGV